MRYHGRDVAVWRARSAGFRSCSAARRRRSRRWSTRSAGATAGSRCRERAVARATLADGSHSCRIAMRARARASAPPLRRRRSRRGSRAASSRWCSSTAAASRRRSCAPPAAGRRAARAAARGSSCIATRRRCAATTAGTPSGCRARVPSAATSTCCRWATARSGSSARSTERFPGARIARIDRDTHAAQGRVRRGARASACRRGRHPGRHADARQGPRLSAPHAGRRAGRRQRALQRRFPRDRAARRAAVPGRRPRGPRGSAGRGHRADGFPGASAVRGARARTTTKASPKAARRARAAALPPFAHLALRRRRGARSATHVDALPATASDAGARAGGAREPTASRCSRRCRERSRAARASSAGRCSCRPRSRAALQRFLPRWREALAALGGARVRWALDVDPIGFCLRRRNRVRARAPTVAIAFRAPRHDRSSRPKLKRMTSRTSVLRGRARARRRADRARAPEAGAARRLRDERRAAAREGAEAQAARARAGARRGAARARRLGRRRSRSRAPGFINIFLTPAARQAVVARILAAGERFGRSDARRGERVHGRVRVGQSDRAAARRPRPPGGARRRDRARCSNAQGARVTREFYYNDAGAADRQSRAVGAARARRSIARRARGFPEDGYRGEYIREIAQRYLDEVGHDLGDIEAIRKFAVAELRKEQDRDLQAFGVRFDNYYLESSLYTDGTVDATVDGLVASRQDLREGRRAVAAHHRLRRRQGPRDAQVRRRLHVLRARRRLPRHQVGARLRAA